MIRLLAQLIKDDQVTVPKGSLSDATFTDILQVVFGFAGGIALIIVTIAGLKYVLSQGNPGETAKAKDTIMYALIGLVVCIMGFSIVTFVINNV